jgi:mono/diheme cytochrome c family protein
MKTSISLFVLLVASVSVGRSQDAEIGKLLYLKDGCYECHGYAGNGMASKFFAGGNSKTRLAQTTLSLSAFTAYVRNPAPGDMPPYRANTMSDKELSEVYAYIKTFPASKSASSIPLLNER